MTDGVDSAALAVVVVTYAVVVEIAVDEIVVVVVMVVEERGIDGLDWWELIRYCELGRWGS